MQEVLTSSIRKLLKTFIPSLWCSPANTPASHAGDHRSEAGQGRQFVIATTSGSTISLPGRLNSRTSPFEGERGGASPSPAANLALGGEIESRLAYTQKSEGQNLPERPASACRLRPGGRFCR
ncbi:hypothetical protein SBV1_1940008 [Verrucomicrobia bacterium]|nr:hypothetical protein SBV1_1940008 [Verrucomicrobiota bacterium]